MAESGEHRELKRLACRWLREQGHVAVGMEVTDSTGRFRVDVAAWSDRVPGPRGWVRGKPRTVLVECKRSRSDYLRDGASALGLLARRAELIDSLSRRGPMPSSLYPQAVGHTATLFNQQVMESGQGAQETRRLRIELALIERRVFRGVKFARLARWRGATQLWVAAPEGMLAPGELPVGWGLLEAPRPALRDRIPEGIPAMTVLKARREAPLQDATDAALARLLRNIAIANSRFVGGRTALVHSGRKIQEKDSTPSKSGSG